MAMNAPARTDRAMRVGVPVIMLALLLASCGGSERPSVDEWKPTWTAIVAGLPQPETLTGDGGEADRAVCTDTLSMLRSSKADLAPTPDLAIDDVVDEWFQIAEDAFFECPPRGVEIDSFSEAYGELDRLEAEVAVVLDIDDAG